MRSISLVILLLVLWSNALYGQDSSSQGEAAKLKAERRTKLIEAVQADSAQLRLPENRAFVAAKLGAAIAKDDPERAATLFRNAVAFLLEAQTIAEANKNPNNQNYDLLTSQSLRPMILTAIGRVDAEYAVDSLYRSRPLALQRALTQTPTKGKINNNSGNFPQLAQQEINLEHLLLKMVAEQKPQKSIAILRESIRKNLSAETLAMLKKVWEKEPATGNELANEVVDRLISKPFFIGSNRRVNYELVNLSNTILTDYVSERSPEERYIAFDEGKMRSLATKVFAAYIDRGAEMGYIPLSQLEPLTKKFSPGSYELLKKAAEKTRGFGGVHVILQDDGEYTKLINSNPSAEILISEARKFPLETRRSLYSKAANKFSEAGQYERALALLNDNFEDDALEKAVSGLNWYYAHHLMNRGEFDQAESMMMQVNESNRISGLISLATTIFNRDQEKNRSRAMGILHQTRSLLPEKPESSNEFSQLVQLITAMAGIEPAEAFRNFESVVGQVNELADAWAIVNRFQGGNIRQGEYMMSSGSNFGIHIDSSLLRTFAQQDAARTLSLVDGLSRREMRVLLLLSLLEGGF